MSQNHGWIALYRQLQDHWLWKDRRVFSRAEAWIDILMQVQHDPETVEHMLGSVPVSCGRGQSIKSLDTWASRWGWTKSATRRFLNLLKKCGNIDTENVTKTTRITVCNYDRYQTPRNANETQVKRKRNASETHLTPDNNGNKGKNENKVNKTTAADVPIPASLDTEAFKAAWADWQADRKQRKKPITERAAKMQLKKLAGWGLEMAIKAIETSIERGWVGLFMPEDEPASAAPTETPQEWADRKLRESKEYRDEHNRGSRGDCVPPNPVAKVGADAKPDGCVGTLPAGHRDANSG